MLLINQTKLSCILGYNAALNRYALSSILNNVKVKKMKQLVYRPIEVTCCTVNCFKFRYHLSRKTCHHQKQAELGRGQSDFWHMKAYEIIFPILFVLYMYQ